MSRFDGTSEDLTYGQALVELAARVSWPSEEHQRDVVTAVRKEHGLWQEPDYSADPEDLARAREAVRLSDENAALRADLAARKRAEEVQALEAENKRLAAELADAKPKTAAKTAAK